MQFANAKTLAQARRNLMEKVRQASGTGVRVFERSMNNDLQVPSNTRGLSFLSALTLFFAFIAVLSYESAMERAPLEGTRIRTAVLGVLGNASSIITKDRLKEYLAHELPYLMLQQRRIGNGRRVGSIRVRSIRTLNMCPSDSYWGRVAFPTNVSANGDVDLVSCAPDVTSNDVINRSALVGALTNITFPFVEDASFCRGLMCAIDLPSAVLDYVSYPYVGNEYFLDNGHLVFANGTTMFPQQANNNNSGNAPTVAAPSMADVVEDFIEEDTRFVQIEATLYNPTLELATSVLVNFESPESGGIFPNIVVQSVVMFDVNHPRCIFLWFYAILQIALNCYALVQSLRHTFDCVTCSQSNILIVFKCVKCRSPCELCIGKVSLCGSCGTPVPALKHSCWRNVVYDVWRMTVILSVSSLIASRFATTYSVLEIEALMNDPLLGIASGQTNRLVSLAPAFSMFRQGVSTIIVTVICTYIRLFHYVCRGQSGSQFARVLQYSLVPLIGFSFNFLVAYSGFCFALNIAGGARTVNFSTLSNTYLTSFRFLLSQIGWSELGTVTPSILTLLVLFFVVCLCLMFNIFPSVLSVSYKKAARTPYYDVDVMSLWLLLKRYVLIPLKVIRKKNRRMRSSTTASIASASSEMTPSEADDRASSTGGTESTSRQIDALRAGAQIEDVLALQELKQLISSSDDLVLKLTVREEVLHRTIADLSGALRSMCELLPTLLEERLAKVEKETADRRAAPLPQDVAAALDAVRAITDANRWRIDALTTHRIALPIIEDSSLLEPVDAPAPVFQDSDDGDGGDDSGEEVDDALLDDAEDFRRRGDASAVRRQARQPHATATERPVGGAASLQSLDSFRQVARQPSKASLLARQSSKSSLLARQSSKSSLLARQSSKSSLFGNGSSRSGALSQVHTQSIEMQRVGEPPRPNGDCFGDVPVVSIEGDDDAVLPPGKQVDEHDLA